MALQRTQALSKDVATAHTYSNRNSAAEKGSLGQGYRNNFSKP